jgi:hypothetical protein
MVAKFVIVHKKGLEFVGVLFALICMFLLFLFRGKFIPLNWFESRFQLSLLASPFFLLGVVILLLTYGSWIKNKGGKTLVRVKKIFFWVLTCVYFLIVLSFFWYFIFY